MTLDRFLGWLQMHAKILFFLLFLSSIVNLYINYSDMMYEDQIDECLNFIIVENLKNINAHISDVNEFLSVMHNDINIIRSDRYDYSDKQGNAQIINDETANHYNNHSENVIREHSKYMSCIEANQTRYDELKSLQDIYKLIGLMASLVLVVLNLFALFLDFTPE